MLFNVNPLWTTSILTFFISTSICFSTPNDYDPQSSSSEAQYKEGELIVRFAPKDGGVQTTIEERYTILAGLGGGEIKRAYKLVPGLNLIKLPEGVKVEEVLANFNNTVGILYAQPNYILKATSTFPNDPRGPTPDGGEQWGLHNTGQTGGTPDADIDAPQAWDIATDSNIIVAVIDSGVVYTHPDLAANMWINPGEDHPPLGSVGPEDFDGINDDGNYDSKGNPLIDDIYGYDFCTFGGKEMDSDPIDDNGHGTHCAGIIGAVGNNEEGVTGVCWNVKIMALKWMTDMLYGYTSDAIECIDYAVAMGAKVLSNSYGGDDYSQSLKDSIEAAGAAGVLFVAAAGNDGTSNDYYPFYPASFDCSNIISVLATDSDDGKWSSSNYGATSVDLGAPGSAILSCFLGNSYEYKSGTSMAAPYVAGACALLWSIYPTLSHLEVKNIILNTVDQLSDLDGRCVTGGRLNLFNALAHTTSITLNKVDSVNDGNCVSPGNDIHYTISYANPVFDSCDPNYIGDVNDAVITDFLPYDLEFSSASGPNSVYHPISHTVTWNIGKLEPNESGFVTLTVTVNDCIRGCGAITNLCKIRGKIEGDDKTLGWASENTPVCSASHPEPACGEIVDLDTGKLKLTWCPGLFAADVNGHEVYFSKNFYEVRDANNSWPIGEVYKGTVDDSCYTIDFCDLDVHTTYYWRIDEVNEPNLWKGGVWSFSTGDSLVLENFDSYVDSDAMKDVWNDYWYNGTSAEVFIDNKIVRNGVYSMRYFYDNDYGLYYSDAEADIFDLPDLPNSIDQNWLSGDAKSLGLYFYGRAGNPVSEQMYMGLTDGDGNTAFVPYDGDMNDVKKEEWQEWNVLLQDFVDANDVNLANVASIIIRFGEPGGPQGTEGTVNFEDIRLHFWRPTDFDRDEIVNFLDYAILAAAWLTQAGDSAYNEDCDLEDNNSIDYYDLALFCDDWLWPDSQTMAGGFGMGQGFSEPLYTEAPTEQPQPESHPLNEQDITIQELIDRLEELWLTDEQIRQQYSEAEWLEFIESVEQTPID